MAPKRAVLTAADYALFEAIGRHGPLPSNYLYAFTRHLRKSEVQLKNRLTEFYNGDAFGPYLTRPPQQFAGVEARYQHVAYDLAPRARDVLEERGLLIPRPSRSDPFLHQIMQACAGASLELACTKLGLRYVSREEIFRHPKCGPAKDAKNPMAIAVPDGTLVPDDLFGIEYPGKGFRFFAVEIDRQTESMDRSRLVRSTIAQKVASYRSIIRSNAHSKWWGLPKLSVLFITTSPIRARNIMSHVKANASDCSDRFAATSLPMFGADWRVPRTVLFQLLEEPWLTPDGTRDLSQP